MRAARRRPRVEHVIDVDRDRARGSLSNCQPAIPYYIVVASLRSNCPVWTAGTIYRTVAVDEALCAWRGFGEPKSKELYGL